jgi:hypothetical protein
VEHQNTVVAEELAEQLFHRPRFFNSDAPLRTQVWQQ